MWLILPSLHCSMLIILIFQHVESVWCQLKNVKSMGRALIFMSVFCWFLFFVQGQLSSAICPFMYNNQQNHLSGVTKQPNLPMHNILSMTVSICHSLHKRPSSRTALSNTVVRMLQQKLFFEAFLLISEKNIYQRVPALK